MASALLLGLAPMISVTLLAINTARLKVEPATTRTNAFVRNLDPVFTFRLRRTSLDDLGVSHHLRNIEAGADLFKSS